MRLRDTGEQFRFGVTVDLDRMVEDSFSLAPDFSFACRFFAARHKLTETGYQFVGVTAY